MSILQIIESENKKGAGLGIRVCAPKKNFAAAGPYATRPRL